MLTVYRSNRAEWLASVLSEQLRLMPPEPFERVDVIVNTWPTSRWLTEELAKTNEISALIRFPFPGERLKQLVGLVLGIEEVNQDPWKANSLVWQLIEVFPEFLASDEGASLKGWVNEHSSKSNHLNRENWKLIKSIASAFNDYALYRPDLLNEWISSTNQTNQSFREKSVHENWQASLARLLYNKIEHDPFGLQVQRAVKRLKSGKSPAKPLPKHLYIFGISSLAPVQIELIQALSGVVDIKFFLLTPCKDLWQRLEVRREQLGKYWVNTIDGEWLQKSARLESTLGRMGAEFQQLLEGSGESQLGEWQEGDLFAAPTNIAAQANLKPTLLEQLQQQLISSDDERLLERDKQDTSLLFMACPGQLRQVQLVRDQILQWLAADLTLEPRDVLIMTPQIERYAPLIASVFNDVNATNVELPWRITDRSQEDVPGVIQYMLELLEVSGKRINATNLEALLGNPAIQKQQGLNQEDVRVISDYLQLTGFRWGLDAEERNGNELHSLSWCLDRWLLGLILPEKTGFSHQGTAPFSQGITANDLTRWWGLLSQLCNQIRELRKSRRSSEWVELLKGFVKELFDDGGSWSWELKCFLAALDDWLDFSKDSEAEVDVTVVAEILNEALTAQAGRFGHRSGMITISALEPMRAIPHKVIVLMGLDSDIFPRYKNLPGFHLLDQKRRLGDPRMNDQDRYALLEAIMSTRKHLLLTWNSRNERTGEAIPPANPIQQWLGQLKNNLNQKSWNGLLKEAHPNPLASTNFLQEDNSSPISCDRRNLEARLCLNKASKPQPLGLALPLKWEPFIRESTNSISNEILKSWLLAPQLVWLENIQLRPKEWINPLKNLEELDFTELQRYRLIKDRLIEVMNSTAIEESIEIEALEDWESRYAGQGTLPPGNAGSLECELLEKRWQNLSTTIKLLGPCQKRPLQLSDKYEEVLWAKDRVIIIEPGTLKSKNAMEGWLLHLQVNAITQTPTSTVVIARSSSKAKKDIYEIALQWNELSSNDAKGFLAELKQMAFQGLQECWPVPPESGWALFKASSKGSDKALKSFQQKWDGVFDIQGERQRPEMQLCFGTKLEASEFLKSEGFHNAYKNLYQPMTEYLCNQKVF